MTQEKADKIFATELGQQLDHIWVTPDDKPFIRHEEAMKHCVKNGFSFKDITIWYPSE